MLLETSPSGPRAIQRSPDPLEVRLWGARDVEILHTPLEDYIDRLREAIGSAAA